MDQNMKSAEQPDCAFCATYRTFHIHHCGNCGKRLLAEDGKRDQYSDCCVDPVFPDRPDGKNPIPDEPNKAKDCSHCSDFRRLGLPFCPFCGKQVINSRGRNGANKKREITVTANLNLESNKTAYLADLREISEATRAVLRELQAVEQSYKRIRELQKDMAHVDTADAFAEAWKAVSSLAGIAIDNFVGSKSSKGDG